MIHGVAVQHRAAQVLQGRQSAGFSRAGAAGEADENGPVGVHQVEARRLFQAVGHRQTQAPVIGALGENFRDVRAVEGAQGVEYVPGLGGFVCRRAQTMDDVPGIQRGILIEADDPRLVRQQAQDAAGAAVRRAGSHSDRRVGGHSAGISSPGPWDALRRPAGR